VGVGTAHLLSEGRLEERMAASTGLAKAEVDLMGMEMASGVVGAGWAVVVRIKVAFMARDSVRAEVLAATSSQAALLVARASDLARAGEMGVKVQKLWTELPG